MSAPDDISLDLDFDATGGDPDRELAAIQAAAAGMDPPSGAEVAVNGKVVTSARTVELNGRRFRIADNIGLMPLLKFSAFADVAVQDPRALAAMYAMLKDCIHPGSPGCGKCEDCKAGSDQLCPSYDAGDWRAFEDHACESKADADDLMGVITQTMELISGRPPGQPATSSRTSQRTRAASTGRSSARRARGSRR